LPALPGRFYHKIETMETTFKNKTTKKRFVTEAKKHRKADRFIQGTWLNGYVGDYMSGCFFGCMTQTDNNTLNEASKVMHLPLWLVHVSEKIFEGLDEKQSIDFPVQLLQAVPVGMDSDKSWKAFMYRLLMDKEQGQITFTEKDSDQYKSVEQCANLFLMDDIDELAARSAASAAWSARSAASAASAAWSARSAASAASAAWSAASAAESAESAESAAESAASAASAARSAESAESAAKKTYYEWMRDVLIEVCQKS